MVVVKWFVTIDCIKSSDDIIQRKKDASLSSFLVMYWLADLAPSHGPVQFLDLINNVVFSFNTPFTWVVGFHIIDVFASMTP